jgi:hypothetical protein
MRALVMLAALFVGACKGGAASPDAGGDGADLAALPSHCSDGSQDFDETDLDCGGDCAPCADGRHCKIDGDCVNQLCRDALCRPPTCANGLFDGDETDVDCGGSCPACDVGKGCVVAADCATTVCLEAMCAPSHCGDQRKNADETDVDCGGPSCPTCADGLACLVKTDCMSGICTAGTCRPVCKPGTADCDGIAFNGCETNITNDPTNCGGCNVRCDKNGACTNGNCAMPPMPIEFDGTFVNGQGAMNACTDWKAWRAKLAGLFSKITLRGTVDPTGYTCIGNNASALCNALRSGTDFSVACDGHTWSVTSCGMDVELSASMAGCKCENAGYVARPCNGLDWGGVNTQTCNPPNQTITVICE